MFLNILLFIYCAVGLVLILFMQEINGIWAFYMLFGGFISLFISDEENNELTEEDIKELYEDIEKKKR